MTSKYGFLSMKFNDPKSEALVRDVIRTAVKAGTGYEVINLLNVARACVIDNHLREQIRDTAFILTYLTHGKR